MRRHGACAQAPQLRARRALQLAMHGICMQISFPDMQTQSFDADTQMTDASGKVQMEKSFSALSGDLLLCWSIKHDWYLATKYLFCAGRQHFASIGALHFERLLLPSPLNSKF